jgi:hypothetical protein
MKRNLYIAVKFTIVLILISSYSINNIGISEEGAEDIPPVIVKETLIDSVWAANRVHFALQTAGGKQFVAYYDVNRMMTVASRKTGDEKWAKNTLSGKLRWDSHNSVAMAVDRKGYIHVSGNMHVNPLAYYRSAEPYDISSMVELNSMTGEEEDDVTYPKFFFNKNNDLLFSYRSGSCGNGNILINRFLPDEEKWERYLKTPLFEGVEENDNRAAYHKFVKDSEGNFHFTWIWRWTPLVETTHQICYATSPDLIHWKNAAGENISLPFHPDDPQVIVDPTPSKGGMHNGRYNLILDNNGKPVIGYLKYDEAGLTQLHLAKFIDDKWEIWQISNWDFRWEFFGGGDQMTAGGEFTFRGLTNNGLLVIDWKTEKGYSGSYVVNAETLELVNKNVTLPPKYPEEVHQRMYNNPEMGVRIIEDLNVDFTSPVKYLLKWETMPPSHGRHAPEIIPDGPVSKLLLVTVIKK